MLGREEPFDFTPYLIEFISPKSIYPKDAYEITKEEMRWWNNRDDHTDPDFYNFDQWNAYKKYIKMSVLEDD